MVLAASRTQSRLSRPDPSPFRPAPHRLRIHAHTRARAHTALAPTHHPLVSSCKPYASVFALENTCPSIEYIKMCEQRVLPAVVTVVLILKFTTFEPSLASCSTKLKL